MKLSGESTLEDDWDMELSGESDIKRPCHETLSGELKSEQSWNRNFSEESRNLRISPECRYADHDNSSDDLNPQAWELVSDYFQFRRVRNSISILTSAMERTRIGRRISPKPRSRQINFELRRYYSHFAAEELELIAVSKRQARLLPHATVVRTDLERLQQEATPLRKIWFLADN